MLGDRTHAVSLDVAIEVMRADGCRHVGSLQGDQFSGARRQCSRGLSPRPAQRAQGRTADRREGKVST